MQISLSYNHGNPLLRIPRAIVTQCSKKSNFLKFPNRWVRNKGVKEVGSEFDNKSKSKTMLFKSPDIGENEELSSNLCSQFICECCKEGDLDRAMSLLSQMEAKGFHLSSTAYACLIEALGNVGRTSEADMLFKEMICDGYKPKLNFYNSLLRGFLKKGLLGLANGVLKEMDYSGIWRSKETYQIFLDYYVGAGRLEDTWSTINVMKQKGFPLNSFVYSKVVGIYRDNGMWKKAIEVLEEIRERGISLDIHICNSIIDTFGKYGELDEALKLFKKMQKEGVRPNIVTWNSLIKWHCKEGDFMKSFHLFTDMQEQGLYPDPKIFVTIISCMGEQGKWGIIKKYFESMKIRGNKEYGAVYAVLVDIYGQYGKFQNARECVQALKSEGVLVSPSIFCVLANAYAQQVIMVLQIMEAEGIEPNIVMLNMLINAFGNAGRYMEAMSVYHHIKESGVSPDVVTYTTLMKAFIRAKKFDEVPIIYKEMENDGCTPDRKARQMLQVALTFEERKLRFSTMSSLSNENKDPCVCSFGRAAVHVDVISRSLRSSSAEPETIATNIDAQIRALSTQGNIEEALSLLYTHSSLSLQTYASLFHACAQKKCLQHGMTLHHYVLHKDPTIQNDVFLTNHIINMYCKCGHLAYARYVFDQMSHRNIVSWTALISGHAQSGLVRECFSLFSGLLAHFRPNEFAFASLLSACEEHDIKCGMQVHAVALKISLDANVYVANSLITMYSKRSGFGGGYAQTPDDAWTMFKSMEFRNLVSWNSMIAGFQLRGLGDKAICLFAHMYCNGIGFDRATLLSVFSSLNECGAFDVINTYLRKCFQLHCLTIKSGLISEIEVVTALIKSYANLGGHISDCYRIFHDTSSQLDIVSWTALISVFAERDPEQAFLLFCQLHRQSYLPDWYTFSIALKACAYFVTEQHAMAIHSQVIKKGFQEDTVLCNALMHAYARCGSLALSEQVFNEMGCHDLVSWNSMLKSYAIHGQAKDALELFQQMNVCPDSATFVALLSACSHVGLVDEGVKLFNSMSDDHGVVPQLDHYSCMVDLYGRAGKIFEAEELIRKMPMKPDSVIWSSLLGSCRKHGETRLAKLAADKFKELEPNNSLGYVQMSNIYSSGGSFTKAGLIRNEMSDFKVRKEPGLSWVEIGKQVHEFGSGGQYHPNRGAILSRLEIVIGQLKEMGYVPELSLALYDTEVEHKEDQLFHHSEKMALVFAIMNEGSLPCGGNVIKIMKNIRICVDCHNFMKLASYLFQKEIVVRDSNRFHRFKYATCSCNDYW
ncbi:Pentatricopeptide repeat-containing protein [Glycine soja]|nr:Pentatricopeptide repeat-containing protein [Glycine soja]